MKNRTLKISTATAFLATLLPNLAKAHPGHGVDQAQPWSALHFIASPEHALMTVIGLAMVTFIGMKLVQALRNPSAKTDKRK
ncbi:hypothetical protein JYU19_02390 [bacterium AH-315-J21]|nr:hypothetical protein [bacterium AH-315-J21]